MPREKRYEEAGAIHHAVVQGNGRVRIVVDDRDRTAFVERLVEVAGASGWSMYAWSLLDTHAHLVVRTAQPNLGSGTGRLVGWYGRRFHLRHGGDGALFRPRFWSRRILDETQLLRSALYVDLNPVAAGLAVHPSRYRWCSYGRADRPWLVGLLGRDLATAMRGYGELVDTACERLRAQRLPDAVERILARAGRVPAG